MDQNGKVDLNGTLMHLSDIKWSENTLKLRKGYQRNDKWRNKQKQTNRWAPLPFIDYEPEGHHNVISVMEHSGQTILLQSGSNIITLAVFHLHSSTKPQVMFVSIYNACKCWSYQIILTVCSKTWWASYRGSIFRHVSNVKARFTSF